MEFFIQTLITSKGGQDGSNSEWDIDIYIPYWMLEIFYKN